MTQTKEKNTRVVGVESISDDLETFSLIVKKLPISFTISRKHQPKTFALLMDAMRDDSMINNSDVFAESNKQFGEGEEK